MDEQHNDQTVVSETPHGKVVVELTAYGHARTVTPYPTGLYFKISVGRIDCEDPHEAAARTVEDLPPELYNAVFDSLIDDDWHFGDLLRELAEHFDE